MVSIKLNIWKMELIISLIHHTVLLNQDTELLSHSKIMINLNKSTYIHSNHSEIKEFNGRCQICTSQHSEILCRLIHHILEDILLHSMLNMVLLIQLILTWIQLMTMNIKTWTLQLMTGKQARTDKQKNFNMLEERH